MTNQKDVYRRLIDFEEQAATIYLRMASRFSPESPELGSLWLEMGIQEKQHAGLLQFCLAEGLFAKKLPREEEIRAAEALFANLMSRSSNPNLTSEDAFQIALELETSEVNDIYDSLTTPLHPSMYLLRRKITASVPDHVEHLLREARRFNVPEESLKKLELLIQGKQSK